MFDDGYLNSIRFSDVWCVFIDHDMTMRSSMELEKIFATEELAKYFVKDFLTKYPSFPKDYIQIRKMKVE